VTNGAISEDSDIGSTSPDIYQADSQLFFIIAQHRIAGTELLQDQIIHFQSTAAHTLDDVLGRADCAGNHMHPGLQAHTGHTHRLLDPLLLIDDELLGQDMQNLLIGWYGYSAGGIDHPLHITVGHLVILDCHNAVGVETANVAASDTGMHRMNLATGHQLCLLHCPLNRLNGGLNIHHHTLLQAT